MWFTQKDDCECGVNVQESVKNCITHVSLLKNKFEGYICTSTAWLIFKYLWSDFLKSQHKSKKGQMFIGKKNKNKEMFLLPEKWRVLKNTPQTIC